MHNLRAPLVLPWLLLAHIGLPQTASPPTDRDPASTTDEVRLSEILISTPQPYGPDQVAEARQKAEQVRAAIGRNGTFADIARADSQGPSAAQGGDVGCFHHGNLAKKLDDLVFRMQVGDVSDVLRTKQGFVILEVSGRGADACGAGVGQSSSPATEAKPQPPASSPDQKDQNHDFGLGIGTHGRQLGALDILSDTQGVDFGPYLKRVVWDVRENWYRLIPKCAEMMKGKLAIEFAITKDGRIADMRLVATSGVATLDRAAWGGIYTSNPFKPLPSEFTGPYLALRFRFYYNPNRSDSDASVTGCNDPVKVDLTRNGTKTKSGIAVSITVPLPGDTDVPLGALKFVRAVVTGTGSKENTVEWSISSFGCSEKLCGEMTKDAYRAPTVMPSSPFVTLTAVSTADPDAKASVTLHIVGSNPSK